MIVFVGLFLLPLVTCSPENVENFENPLSKRGLDHRSNLALLNNLNFEENNKPAGNLNIIPSSAPSIVNVANPTGENIPGTVNTDNLAIGNPNPISNGVLYPYAPSYTTSYPQNLPLIQTPVDNSIFYLTADRPQTSAFSYDNLLHPGLSLVTASNANLPNGVANTIQDNKNVFQTYIPQQNVVEVPQGIQLIREVKVPQPYPVHITRTVQVPVHIRVPVEVPRPYAVRVPHPVPVPIHIKVPVPVAKPYPVQITKTVAVPVEKPVYIKVPQPIQVPVAQPYPVGVPHPFQVQLPYVVRLPELTRETASGIIDDPAPPINNFNGDSLPVTIPSAQTLPEISPITRAIADTPVASTTECSSCKGEPNESVTAATTSPRRSLPPITGTGLLPPHPPSSISQKSEATGGLLKSYVSSKEGGVFRRGTEYQTKEYRKTW